MVAWRAAMSGQRIGSLRLVFFAGTSGDPEPRGGILEIETKTGRYFHMRPSQEQSAVVLAAGPATIHGAVPGPERGLPPARDNYRNGTPAAPLRREWRDLTETFPGAFDQRPMVTAIRGLGSRSGDSTAPAAEAWKLTFSNGYTIQCSCEQNALSLVGAQESEPQPGRGPGRR